MAVNNVQLEYQQIDTVSSQLKNAVENISPQLMTLRTSVENLLSDGLFLQHTSPAMKTAYSQFTDQLQQVVTKINDFAKQFTDIKIQIDDMDTKMAAQINGHK
ncbi:hypothetical protein NMG29_09355 [Streptomyces cocklensis]|jgi:SMC interacting uncharacterized protein involved in chromosome segregation|uniref:Uncharacterized protein n=1 Tax=Actinacidiphila cocklensis TaxID=887465 RepID=A0A9W4DIX8_9ACTN|nr:hypothetical protein [Actinacidiphila cocklensis]MDD1058423.1 hypothetical protein [Actinacidiphila cocklensis]WSX75366.1 hypothetical protein OH826_16550 [Streptomyces sp. NBC_00899]CAG6390571.1 conserved hypothetical protein [Actinacidiphila cocklensis]